MRFSKIEKIKGELTLPGDKSISHRSLLFSAMAKGTSKIENLADSDDVKATIDCLRKLNIEIEENSDSVVVNGAGKKGFKPMSSTLYCGNSGTTSRLISGILAAQDFPIKITGDESLSSRPMKRVIYPLEKMGCRIESNDGKLPLQLYPQGKINAIEHTLPVASAQIKGAVLLAGLHSAETTTVIENDLNTRSHTEKMLSLPVEIIGGKKYTKVSDKYYPVANDYFIPGDISTAAFFMILVILSKHSELLLKDVSLNETRTGFINVLKEMDAAISIEQTGISNNEPYGNIFVQSSKLKNIEIDPALIPGIIDEIPILSIAGVFARGNFIIKGVKELRVKESDRINSICKNLKIAGLEINEFDDGFSAAGTISNKFLSFESFGDHRIAMAFAVMCCLHKPGGEVNGFGCVSVSNPEFLKQLITITTQ
jgi:3-phosphoshikimate 1-carboxyvinyltransferase